MILRLRSGSSTPASRARKRSSASTWTSGMPNCSKASTTCSASFSRIRPWSTKTQVSLLADRAVDEQRRDRGVDAAGEAADHPALADLGAGSSRPARRSPTAATTAPRSRRRRAGSGSGSRSRRGCGRPRGGTGSRRGRGRAPRRRRPASPGLEASAVNPSRRLEDRVAVAHPAALLLRQAAEQACRRRRAGSARCGRTPPTRPPRPCRRAPGPSPASRNRCPASGSRGRAARSGTRGAPGS